METQEYYTISQLAKILGLSRVTVFHRVKKGEIPSVRIGHIYGIPRSYVAEILGKNVSESTKRKIDAAVRKTVEEYGEVLKKLGRE